MLNLRAATSSISRRASRGSGFCQKAFFCSEVGDGSNSTVLVAPRHDIPLFPLLEEFVDVKDPSFSALHECYKLGQAPYACVSLLKDLPPGTEKSMNGGAKGKEVFDRLHKVGTLAKIDIEHDIDLGSYLYLTGLRRVRITEMVSEDPLTVKVDPVKDLPFNEDDLAIKAMFSEVRSGLKDFLVGEDTPSLCQLVDGSNCQELASFGAGFLMANKYEYQAILEELDVHQRLKQTLKLLRRTMAARKMFSGEYNARYGGKEEERLARSMSGFYF